MDTNTKVIGHWELLKILGSGGFGQVSLWCNISTGQKIAVKKLIDVAVKDPSGKDKLIERWCNEVEIMRKLNHANVVSTLEIPSDFDFGKPLPVLAMEYCCKGDLRQVLNKAENCCGLREPIIVNILRDISNGLAYLHSCKIIHRDIKPDNIVLQEKDSHIIYKLIDLGYAKALDQSSLSQSFVGTAQYIAPELFMGKAYTSSVDYWSFGIMTHEIITGHRPFLPGRSPSEWMKQIQNKSRNIIRAVESNTGEIVFHETISRKNHSSRCFVENVEKWLQLALDWNGQKRGRDTEKNRIVIFENLSEILCKKLMNVFSLPTYEILSYEIIGETDIADLRRWLKDDTHIEEEDQLLLLPSGKCMKANGNLLQNIEFEKPNRSFVALFLFDSSGPISIKTDGIKSSISLQELGNSTNQTWPFRQLKRYFADSMYFLQSQAALYQYLLQGIKVKITHTKQKTLAIESLYEDLVAEWNQIEHYGHFLSLSHKIDLENYIYYRKLGKLKSSSFARKWIQNAIDVSKKIIDLRSSFNKTKRKQLLLVAKQTCRNLDDNSNNDHAQRTSLDSLVGKGHILWENLQKLSKNEREVPGIFFGNIVELINKAEEETNKLLKSEMLRTLFLKIWEADESLAKFLSQLTNIYRNMTVLKRFIENTQLERQKQVWSLIEQMRNEFYEQEGNSENGDAEVSESKSAKVHKCEEERKKKINLIMINTVDREESESSELKEAENNEINYCDLPFGFGFVRASCSPDAHDACSVIEENNHLRYRIQEVQQKCNQMLKEISSLKWDFV